MEVPEVCGIELTPDEATLFAQVNFTTRELADHAFGDSAAMLEATAVLTEQLLARDAIPAVRLRWFTDADLNIGGHGKSRQQVFFANGCDRDEMIHSPHFIQHLRYFVVGPELPQDVIQGFRAIVEDDRGTSGEVMDQLSTYARSQARRLKSARDYGMHEEFFKLALECGVDDYTSSVVRKAVQSVRPR